ETVARLVDIAELYALADGDGSAVGLFLPGDHAEEGGLAGAVRADDADNAAGRQLEGEVVDQQAIAEALRQPLEIHDVVTEPLGDGNDDLRRTGRLVGGLLDEIVITLDARLALGLAGLGGGGDPFGLG